MSSGQGPGEEESNGSGGARAARDRRPVRGSAGPATLSAAIRLIDPCRERGIDPPERLVIEKASEIWEHQFSGAVMKPTAIAELIPE